MSLEHLVIESNKVLKKKPQTYPQPNKKKERKIWQRKLEGAGERDWSQS